MAKKSVLVYQFLKSENPKNGFLPKEILERVSQTHGFTPGKGLRRQINAALKRGVDFGILTKEKHRYKFDIGDSQVRISENQSNRKNRRKKKKKPVTKKPKAQINTKTRKKTRTSIRKQKELPPRPRVPPPPNWKSKPRNLREEPIQKFIQHDDNY